MPAKSKDLYIEQGTDWQDIFDIFDRLGNPANLVGATGAMEIRSPGGTTVIATLTSENGKLVMLPDTYQIGARLGFAATTTMVPGEYDYDLKVRSAEGIIYRAERGCVEVSEQITVLVPPAATGTAITGNNDEPITGNNDEPITT